MRVRAEAFSSNPVHIVFPGKITKILLLFIKKTLLYAAASLLHLAGRLINNQLIIYQIISSVVTLSSLKPERRVAASWSTLNNKKVNPKLDLKLFRISP